VKVNVDKCEIMNEKARCEEDCSVICYEWRAGSECGLVQMSWMHD